MTDNPYTEQWLIEHDHKLRTSGQATINNQTSPLPAVDDPGPESNLQSKIKTYCKDNGWPCLSFPQTKAVRNYLTPGWPDMTICLPKGRVLFLELKAAGKGLRDKQKEIRIMLMHLGHEYHVCRSYRKFVEILYGA